MKTHLKFPVANRWIGAELGAGHLPQHPGYVTLAACETDLAPAGAVATH